MAKSPRLTDSSSNTWLTAAEQRVLDATVGSPLATATRNQLLAAIKQARSLRDKWRDLFTRQSIASKKGAARTNDPVNTRSLEKAELFGAAVKRLEARIEELAEAHFGPEVCEPVRLHVAAKRYLTAVEPDYMARLSGPSVTSLMLQGGPMSPAELEAFRGHPHWQAARATTAIRRGRESGQGGGATRRG